MHIAVAILVIFLVLRRGVWRDWRQYHATILFFGFMQLAYNFIVEIREYHLWKLIPDFQLSQLFLISLYTFIIYPGATILYLDRFPTKLNKQIIYFFKWVFVCFILETIAFEIHKIEYFNGWLLWHSLIFYIILFIGLVIHHRRPIIGYIAFVIITMLGIWAYKIPI